MYDIPLHMPQATDLLAEFKRIRKRNFKGQLKRGRELSVEIAPKTEMRFFNYFSKALLGKATKRMS